MCTSRISLAVIIPGLIAWGIHGFNLGIDFTGGGLLTYQLAQPMSGIRPSRPRPCPTRDQAAGYREHGADCRQRSGRADQILVRTRIDPQEQNPQDKLKQQKPKITDFCTSSSRAA